MYFSKQMKEVAAAVIMKDKRILITRRGPDSKLAGYWEFPGGKVEEGETRRECLERELYEELGIQAHAGEEIAESEYHYDHGAFLIIAIEAFFDGDEIILTDHDDLAWVSPSDLQKYKLAPADVPLAKSIQLKYNDEN